MPSVNWRDTTFCGGIPSVMRMVRSKAEVYVEQRVEIPSL